MTYIQTYTFILCMEHLCFMHQTNLPFLDDVIHNKCHEDVFTSLKDIVCLANVPNKLAYCEFLIGYHTTCSRKFKGQSAKQMHANVYELCKCKTSAHIKCIVTTNRNNVLHTSQ